MPIFTQDDYSQGPTLDQFKDDSFSGSFVTSFKNNYLSMTRPALNYIANKMDPGETLSQNDAHSRLKMMDAEELKEKIPEGGIGSNALYSMVQENKDDKKRAALASMATGTMGSFFGSVASGFADPLGVAATAIPFLGASRYTSILAKLAGPEALASIPGPLTSAAYTTALEGAAGVGKTLAAKATFGAAQGALGMAAIEPANAFFSKQMGKDYSFTQSLENIAFGAAMGGGLHMATFGMGQAGEAVKNTLSKFTDPERADVMKIAVAHMLEDKEVNVAPAVEGYAAGHEGTVAPQDMEAFGNQKKAELAKTGAESPGTIFENPQALADHKAELAEVPHGPEVEIAKQHADDAMADFQGKAKQLDIEDHPEIKAADEQIKTAKERDTARRILTLCAHRGEG